MDTNRRTADRSSAHKSSDAAATLGALTRLLIDSYIDRKLRA